jgi:hypothetical protein
MLVWMFYDIDIRILFFVSGRIKTGLILLYHGPINGNQPLR